ncbi:MAG: hypothetical protein ACOY4R_10610 [Pseudomonadota bacterium]
MAKRTRLRVGTTVAVGMATLMVCGGIAFVFVGDSPDATTTIIGYVAMGIGLLAATLLGVGLALLINRDKRGD